MKTTWQRFLFAGGLFLWGIATPAVGTMIVQNFDANKHHRFANNANFIGAPYNWSGVARASNGRWLTMISPTYFVTANHVYPANGNSVVFYENNDPSGNTITCTVLSTTRIGNTDIRIGRLNTAPGPTIAIYGIASNTINQADFTSSVYNNREVLADLGFTFWFPDSLKSAWAIISEQGKARPFNGFNGDKDARWAATRYNDSKGNFLSFDVGYTGRRQVGTSGIFTTSFSNGTRPIIPTSAQITRLLKQGASITTRRIVKNALHPSHFFVLFVQ